MHRVNDIVKSKISSTGKVRVVGLNTESNHFIPEGRWDYIVVEYDEKDPEKCSPSVKIKEDEL